MFQKTIHKTAVLVTASLLLLVGAAAAVTADAAGTKMTICHKPSTQAHTMEVSRAAWAGHEQHGDHRGPCDEDLAGSASKAGSGSGDGRSAGAPPAHVSLSVASDGDVDGKAVFDIEVTSERRDAFGVSLSARLRGDGEWSVRSADADCSIEDQTLACDIGRLDEGAVAKIRVRFDAGPQVCEEPRIFAIVEASNDDGADDNEARSHAYAGACAIRDEPPT